MTSATDNLDLPGLLGDEPFVRGLARSLLFDEHQVDDVVQQTWLEALSAAKSSRSFLATVVRSRASNVRRAHARTVARERAAARVEALPSTAELLEREELRRTVVEAVGALPETYRVVVLLRFYEGLPPRRIAAELGIPRETAATRLKRGIGMLRERLDAAFDGDRRAWCLGLVPIAVPAKAGVVGALVAELGTSVGVIFAMKNVLAVILFGVVVLAFGLGLSGAFSAPPPEPDPVVAVAGADAGGRSGSADPDDDTVQRQAVVPTAREQVSSPPRGDLHIASVQAALCGFHGRLVGPDGGPAADEEVRLLGLDPVHALGSVFDPDGLGAGVLDAGTTAMETRTAADGRFAFAGVRPDAMYALHAGVGGAHPTWLLLERTAGPGQRVDLGTVELVAKGELSGRVVDDAGEPIAGASVLAADVPGALLSIAPVDRVGPRGGLLLAVPRVTFDGGPDLPERYHDRLRSHLAKRVTVADENSTFVALETPSWFSRVWDELPIARGVTGPDGRFVLRGVQPGSGMLVVRAEGFARGMKPRVLTRAQDRRDVGDIRLRRGEACGGVVLDSVGEPIRAELRLASQPPVGLTGLLFAGEVVPVDADGRFDVSGLPREDLFIAARRGAGRPWVVHGPFDPADEDIEIRFEGLRDVVVQVASSAEDAEIADLRVTLRRGPPLGELTVSGLQPELPVACEIDAGCATLRGLEPGVYTLQASASGHAVGVRLVEVPTAEGLDAEPVAIAVTLQPVAPVRVRVTDEHGAPIEGAQVFAQSSESVPAWARSVLFGFGPIQPWDELARFAGFTGPDGGLDVAALPAGPAKISVRHPAYGTGWTDAILPAEDTVIALQRCGVVFGRLYENGRPAAADSHRLVAEPADSDAPIPGVGGQARLAADGTFRFEGIVPGRVEIKVEDSLAGVRSLSALIENLEVGHSWFDNSRSVEVTVVPGGEHEVVFDVDEDTAVPGSGGRIEIQVTIDGQPAEGLRVGKSWFGENPLGRTDVRGVFASAELVAQTYDLVISSEDGERALWHGEVEVAPGQVVSRTVDLRYATVTGRVTRANGLAAVAHSVNVFVELANGGGAGVMAETDADGRFEARAPAGRTTLWVEGAGGAVRVEAFDVPAGGVVSRQVVLDTSGVFSGRIVGAEKTFEWIRLQPQGSSTFNMHRIRDDGTFAINRLRAGVYDLALLDDQFGTFKAIPSEITFDVAGMVDQVVRVGEPIE